MHKKPPIKIILSKQKPSDLDGYLKIRIGIPNTDKYLFRSFGERVPAKLWDKKTEKLKTAHPESSGINLYIHDEKNRIEREFVNRQIADKPFTVEYVESVLDGSGVNDLLKFHKEYLDYITAPRKDGKKHTKGYGKFQKRIYNILDRYSGGRLPFDSIDVRWLEQFEQHHAKTMNNKTTLPVLMGKVIELLRNASKRGLFDMVSIVGYKKPVYKNPVRPYLTLEQTDKISADLYAGKFDYEPSLRLCAAFFLVETYSGIRFSDWGKFKIEKIMNNRSLKLSGTTKTGAPIYMRLDKSPRLSKIVDFIADNNMVFDFTEQFTNRQLKEVSRISELGMQITTHVGRHSYAVMMLQLRYTIDEVAEFMGVSANTVKIYAKMTSTALNNAYDRLGGL